MSKEILIVEDDLDMQLFYKEMLEGEGYHLTFASSGKEGIKKVREKVFDLVILDIIMEEPTGDRLFAMMRNDSRFKNVPVIFASVFRKDTYACTKVLGHVSFLEKPFTKEVLLEEIKKDLKE
ncbi:MAG: response regulator [Candidatus Brocadiales bacterium]|nr:response regulator [Candidatus Brocadiales bacterium]